MSNMTLAVKYRPQSWDALIGQDTVAKILRKQIETGNVKHCYLFCGSAGCGKTTSARIVAKLINEGKGRSIELDCASKNGVDDVRGIIDECKSRPFDAKYKIFILDEAHMLTTAANNALLKIFEEPPEWVIFILCTTDPQKIIGTIHSRVQRMNFKRVSVEAIADRLEFILKSEGIETYTREALEYIARLAKGGVRDSITSLEKCLDYSPQITLDNVLVVLSGGVTEDILFDFMEKVLKKQVQEALQLINKVYMDGIDMSLFDKLFREFLQSCVLFLIMNNENVTTLSSNTTDLLKVNYSDKQTLMSDLLFSYINKSDNLYSEEMKIMLESWVLKVCF